MARFDSILETIGDTPVVKIQRLAPPGVNLYVKVESFNPMGSVKDRMARAVIEEAERSGALRPGQTVIEATSGNTGIALAMVCAQKGYPLVVTMAENFSVERRRARRQHRRHRAGLVQRSLPGGAASRVGQPRRRALQRAVLPQSGERGNLRATAERL